MDGPCSVITHRPNGFNSESGEKQVTPLADTMVVSHGVVVLLSLPLLFVSSSFSVPFVVPVGRSF